MIFSVISFWFIFAIILIPSVIFSVILPVSEVKSYLSDTLILSFFVYISWNVSCWLWRKYVPSVFKAKVNPSDRAILITGCDSGFGNKLAIKCYDYGFTVFAGCLFPDKQGAQDLKQLNDVSKENKIHIIPLDVTKDDSVDKARQLVDDILIKNEKIKLHSIVNNAGIMIATEIEMGNMTQFINQIEVNSLGVIRITKKFLPLLRGIKNSRIVNVASLAGRFSIPGMVGYCVSKCAVISFSDGLRRELKKFNIDVITIEPHLFNTNLVNNEINHRYLQSAWNDTPEEIKTAYGDSYFDGYKKFLDKILGSARPRVQQVVDTMFTAVTELFVSPNYMVLGDLEALRVWMWNLWPTRALDQLSYLAAIAQTGKPSSMEKIKAIYEKKKAL